MTPVTQRDQIVFPLMTQLTAICGVMDLKSLSRPTILAIPRGRHLRYGAADQQGWHAEPSSFVLLGTALLSVATIAAAPVPIGLIYRNPGAGWRKRTSSQVKELSNAHPGQEL
jgi:hypothetical protein